MKKKQGLLVMLLGCLVTVTAIAGVLVWRGTGKEDGESYAYHESESSSEQLSWNDETADTKEETEETLRETEETQAPETEPETRQAAAGQVQQEESEAPSEAPAAAAQVHSVSFGEADKLGWPISGSILMEYSIPTLDEYKCSPGVLIQGEVGTQVAAPADALVKVVGSDEELGNYVTLDLGDGYELTCGQLEQITLSPGDYVEAGAAMGVIAAPTKYYVVEGPNLYVQMTKDGTPIDPLDYME